MKPITILNILAVAIVAAMLTGCVETKGFYALTVTQRGLFLKVESTASTSGTPAITMGLGSQTTTLLPASTNGPVWIVDYANSALLDQTINPFSTSGTEEQASGHYSTYNTNLLWQVPLLYPTNAATAH